MHDPPSRHSTGGLALWGVSVYVLLSTSAVPVTVMTPATTVIPFTTPTGVVTEGGIPQLPAFRSESCKVAPARQVGEFF